MSKYWFRKRKGIMTKDMGYGWVPISWQGYAVIIATFGVVGLSMFVFDMFSDPSTTQSLMFSATVLLTLTLASLISHRTTRP